MSRERRLWVIFGTGSAIAAGVLARQAVTEAWRRGRGEEPPLDLEDPESSWRAVLFWAGLSGFCVAFGRAFGHSIATRTWRNLLKREPPSS